MSFGEELSYCLEHDLHLQHRRQENYFNRERAKHHFEDPVAWKRTHFTGTNERPSDLDTYNYGGKDGLAYQRQQ